MSNLKSPTRLVLGAMAIPAIVAFAGAAQGELVYGLTTRSQLVTFDSANPGALLNARFITGLAPSEEIVNIDLRPATGELFAMGSYSRLYTINPTTGAATLVGTGFSPLLNGIEFGFDFNPTVDRVRVVSDLDDNFRLNPITGGLAATDTNVAYAAGDPNAGANPNVVGSAYTNNVPGATTTTLYNIDSQLDVLVTQIPPNNGTLNTVGALGVNTSGLVGFDISGVSGVAYAALQTPGDFRSGFYTINLATGAATSVGVIGIGTDPILIRDITVTRTIPGVGSAFVLGAGGLMLGRRRR